MSNKAVKRSRCPTRVRYLSTEDGSVPRGLAPLSLPKKEPLHFSGKNQRGESWLVIS